MAYKKTLWKDRVVEKPNTYRSVENPDGTITLYPITGQVIEKGTPVSAANLNKIENGIVELNEQLEQNKNDILKIKDYTLKNAKFKPNFKHNLYWCEKTELDWENDLLVFKKCGIKKAVLVVMIEKDSDNTFRLENKFEKYIKFLNDNHVKYDITHVDIKIHFNFSNQIVIDF